MRRKRKQTQCYRFDTKQMPNTRGERKQPSCSTCSISHSLFKKKKLECVSSPMCLNYRQIPPKTKNEMLFCAVFSPRCHERVGTVDHFLREDTNKYLLKNLAEATIIFPLHKNLAKHMAFCKVFMSCCYCDFFVRIVPPIPCK